MKLLNVTLATILLALTVLNAANVSAIGAAGTNYTLSQNDQASLDSVQAKAKIWYAHRISVLGKTRADADLQAVIDKLEYLQMQYKDKIRSYTIIFKLRLYSLSLLNGSSSAPAPVVATVNTGVAASSSSVGNTSGVIDVAKVKELISKLNSRDPALMAGIRKTIAAMGFSEEETRLLTIVRDQDYSGVGVVARKDIFFCAPFTGEIKDKDGEVPYYVMGKYTDPQTSPTTIANRFRKLIWGTVQWNTNHSDLITIGGLNPDNDNLVKGRLMYVRNCASQLTENTQQDLVNLFAKLGMTYAPQTQPFWEVDPDLITKSPKRTIGDWVKTLFK